MPQSLAPETNLWQTFEMRCWGATLHWPPEHFKDSTNTSTIFHHSLQKNTLPLHLEASLSLGHPTIAPSNTSHETYLFYTFRKVHKSRLKDDRGWMIKVLQILGPSMLSAKVPRLLGPVMLRPSSLLAAGPGPTTRNLKHKAQNMRVPNKI